MNDFFKHDVYICDEKVRAFKSYNSFKIYDTDGNEIGEFMHRIMEKGFFGRQDILICDNRGGVVVSFRTQNAHEGKSRFDKEGGRYILVLNSDEEIIGKIYNNSFANFQILDRNDEVVLETKGVWKATYIDGKGNEIKVAKEKDKFAGAKSVFTKAHKWMVEFYQDVPKSQEELVKAVFLFNSLSGRMNIKGMIGF